MSKGESRKELMREWIGSEPSIPDKSISETLETEVLICGAGHAGLTASVVAGSEGLKTIVIEKNDHEGYYKTYLGAVNSSVAKRHGKGGYVDKEEIVDELLHYGTRYTDERHVYKSDITRSKYQGANPVNEKLIRVWADESGDMIDFLGKELEEFGVKHTLEYDNGDGWHGDFKVYPVHNKLVPPATGGKLAHMHGSLYVNEKFLRKKAENYGVRFMFNTSLVKLVKEGGAVVGAIAKRKDGSFIRINASKGVLLATGGYADDDEAFAKLNPEATAVTTFSFVQKGDTGDGIKAGVWAGAGQDEHPSAMLFDRGITKPGGKSGLPFEKGNGLDAFHLASSPFLKVDMTGNRFCNETVPYDFILFPLQDKPNGVECMIWDRKWFKDAEQFHNVGCSRIAPSKSKPKTYEGLGHMTQAAVNVMNRMKGKVKKAWTIKGLAKKLKLPPDALQATVDRYNAMAEKGVDEDFGKPAKDLIPVNKPPYYGCTNAAWLLCTMDGLTINEDMQVQDKQGNTIPGLYAAGDCAGGFFANNFYPELIVGVASGKSATFARHAIRHMAGVS